MTMTLNSAEVWRDNESL